MLTFTLTADPPPATGSQGRIINGAEAWSYRHEVEMQEAMRQAYIRQSTATVAGRRAEYQPMRNGIDKGFTEAHNHCTHGDDNA